MPSRTDVYIVQKMMNSERICMVVSAAFAGVEKWFWVTNEWHGKVDGVRGGDETAALKALLQWQSRWAEGQN